MSSNCLSIINYVIGSYEEEIDENQSKNHCGNQV